jgi:hypothetical protein
MYEQVVIKIYRQVGGVGLYRFTSASLVGTHIACAPK